MRYEGQKRDKQRLCGVTLALIKWSRPLTKAPLSVQVGSVNRDLPTLEGSGCSGGTIITSVEPLMTDQDGIGGESADYFDAQDDIALRAAGDIIARFGAEPFVRALRADGWEVETGDE